MSTHRIDGSSVPHWSAPTVFSESGQSLPAIPASNLPNPAVPVNPVMHARRLAGNRPPPGVKSRAAACARASGPWSPENYSPPPAFFVDKFQKPGILFPILIPLILIPDLSPSRIFKFPPVPCPSVDCIARV